MTGTRRSRLQKAIIQELQTQLARLPGTLKWVRVNHKFSTDVAGAYYRSQPPDKRHYWPFDGFREDGGLILSDKFKVSYSRSLKKLVEQGIIETRQHPLDGKTEIRLGSLNVNPHLQGSKIGAGKALPNR